MYIYIYTKLGLNTKRYISHLVTRFLRQRRNVIVCIRAYDLTSVLRIDNSIQDATELDFQMTFYEDDNFWRK